ncbi:MAG TPA: hypothetical protein VHU44_04795 [Acidobacteriaceae bacterium]|jgi:hypothetical protein|nr:hypothetical protein [Acidobacteriaceae bacterium]
MQHFFEFAGQVWNVAGPILGSGLLLYLVIAILKVFCLEIETAFDVGLLLLKKWERRALGAISSVRRFWDALVEFKAKAIKAWRSPDVPPISSRSG